MCFPCCAGEFHLRQAHISGHQERLICVARNSIGLWSRAGCTSCGLLPAFALNRNPGRRDSCSPSEELCCASFASLQSDVYWQTTVYKLHASRRSSRSNLNCCILSIGPNQSAAGPTIWHPSSRGNVMMRAPASICVRCSTSAVRTTSFWSSPSQLARLRQTKARKRIGLSRITALFRRTPILMNCFEHFQKRSLALPTKSQRRFDLALGSWTLEWCNQNFYNGSTLWYKSCACSL